LKKAPALQVLLYLKTTISNTKEKNDERKVKKQRNGNLLSKIAVSSWRRRRDSNSRAGFPTYALSRGASSPT
jgi:hypothetical protein